MKLYVLPPSPHSKKVLFANAAMGLDLPVQVLNHAEQEQYSDWYKALNPNCRAPTLALEDGAALWESNAILCKMAAAAKSDLWPASDARYDILRWQFWEASHWTPACSKYIGYYVFGNHEIDLDAAAPDFHKFAAVLEGHLAGRDWLVGDALTLADISCAMILFYAEPCHYPLGEYANILRWWGRIQGHEAFAAVAAASAQAAE
ncbi:Glutathione S-transferase [Candidatus Rhodobacter oscarellae]|uniref:Glutathione S-transferase n=1 Tax=Candidatus Rhodobacter oscarellae TaxID=1675527 RepID=A0A0J9E319_9RHOB|nr:glutathione S-transferase family protein [Candidatus Rhodobacter lobularis]KMW57125.1 Glutathione S-transferase [Candidatus Rhodobacter lobularis]